MRAVQAHRLSEGMGAPMARVPVGGEKPTRAGLYPVRKFPVDKAIPGSSPQEGGVEGVSRE